MINSFSGEYRFLSNFYPSRIEYEGKKWHTVEHAYQAAKTLDEDAKCRIQLADTPGKAKRLGRRVVMRPDWHAHRMNVMIVLVALKFKDPELARLLLATGDHELVEGNQWNDTFWGVCNGAGCNYLGQILMATRNVLETQHAKY